MSTRHASAGLATCAPFLLTALLIMTSAAPLAPAAPPQSPTADGTLDTTFGAGGMLRIALPGDLHTMSALAVQPDGKLLVAGKIIIPPGNQLVLMRFNRDGSPDTTFGSGGKFIGEVGKMIWFSSIVPMPNGKILVGGIAYNNSDDFGLARFNSDGTVDTTFGSDGTVLTDLGSADLGAVLLVQPDGKLLLAGEGGRPNQQASSFSVVRYDAAGNLDRSFGNSGIAMVSFSNGFDEVAAAALQPDGKIVLAGLEDFNAEDHSFALARLNADGSPDASFGSRGKVTTDFFGKGCDALAMAVQADGKIVAAGRAYGSPDVMVMARYNPDGSLDKRFGTGGKVSYDFFGRGGEAHALAVQRDGKIIVGGIAGYDRPAHPRIDFAVLRYNPDGSLDTDFDGDGVAITDSGSLYDFSTAMAIQADGRIILGGDTGDDNGPDDLVVARYLNTLPPFAQCIQDDANGNLLEFTPETGDYRFTACATGVTFTGRASVKVKGCKTRLLAATGDHSLEVLIKTCQGKASATLTPAGVAGLTIDDSSVTNNRCSCR